jgi:catechol 2,3-dioxygenase-like lactoylglutathione lyase family enzyme
MGFGVESSPPVPGDLDSRKARGKLMLHYKGIHHLAMVTRDMDMTIRFWRDLLGMRMIVGFGGRENRLYFFEVAPHELIAFFEWPGAEAVQQKEHGYPWRGPIIFDHVAFGVPSRDDLWTIKDRLEAAGFWVSEAIDHGFIHSVYAFDPNGIPIEFSWEVPGVDLSGAPRMMDRHPSFFALEGSEPQPGKWPPVRTPTPTEERRSYPGEGSELGPDKDRPW